MVKRTLFYGQLFIIFFIFSLFLYRSFSPTPEIVQDGHYHNSADSPVLLQGEWNFYPSLFIHPDDNPSFPEQAERVTVPHLWDAEVVDGLSYGTYSLTVDGLAESLYAIRMNDVRYASRVYANGKLIGQAGQVTLEASEFEASSRKYLGMIEPDEKGQVEFIIHVVNRDYFTGGLVQAPLFGEVSQVIDSVMLSKGIDGAYVVSIFVLSLIYLYLYILDRKKTHLYFSAFLAVLSFYRSLMDERVIEFVLGEVSIAPLTLMQMFSFLLLNYILYYCFITLYPYVIPKKLFNFTKWITIIFTFTLAVNLWFTLYKGAEVTIWSSIRMLLYYGLLHVQMLYMIYHHLKRFNRDSLYLVLGLFSFYMYIFVLFLNLAYEWSSALYANLFLLLVVFYFSAMIFSYYRQKDERGHRLTEQIATEVQLKEYALRHTASQLLQKSTSLERVLNQIELEEYGFLTKEQQQVLVYMQQLHYEMKDLLQHLEDTTKKKSVKHERKSVALTHADIERQLAEIEFAHQDQLKGMTIHLTIHSSSAELLQMDRLQFEQILYPLIENAILHSRGTSIEVTIKTDDQWFKMSVADDGTGIEDKHLPHIFTSFYRGREEREEALGLGLSIVKQSVEQNNGTIEVFSNKKTGTEFIVFLPRNLEKVSHTPVVPVGEHDSSLTYQRAGSSMKILVFQEDVEQLHKTMSDLEPLEHTVIGVRNIEAACEQLSQQEFHLLIVDVTTIQHQDSIFIKRVRENYDMSELPIIVMARMANSLQSLLSEMQVNECIQQPYNANILRSKVELFLNMQQLAQLATRKELEYYVAQISPHFLYNTFNTLISLSEDAPEVVEEALLHLTVYFRAKLSSFQSKELVPLENELELLEAYLSIEQLRFGDRLHIDYSDEVDARLYVPTMSLQTLVEYRINEGVLRREEGGYLRIEVSENEDDVIVLMEDNGVPIPESSFEQMNALHQSKVRESWLVAREQLKRLSNAHIHIENHDEGVRIYIRFSKERNPSVI